METKIFTMETTINGQPTTVLLPGLPQEVISTIQEEFLPDILESLSHLEATHKVFRHLHAHIAVITYSCNDYHGDLTLQIIYDDEAIANYYGFAPNSESLRDFILSQTGILQDKLRITLEDDSTYTEAGYATATGFNYTFTYHF